MVKKIFMFLIALAAKMTCLIDDESEEFITKVATELCKPHKVKCRFRCYILDDRDANAAVTSDSALIVHSGFILHCKNAEEFVGVLAHEIGHVEARHTAQGFVSEAPVAVGLGIGMIPLLPGAGFFLIMMGVNISLQENLRQRRFQEIQADNIAIDILNKIKWPNHGLISFLKSLEHMDQDGYLLTHPRTNERLLNLSKQKNSYKNLPNWITKDFKRIQNKIKGYIEKLGNDPYARVSALMARRNFSEALRVIDRLLQDSTNDPYYMEMKGDILYALGREKEAVHQFKMSYDLKPNTQYIPIKLSHTLMNTGNVDEAIFILNKLRVQNSHLSYTWRLLARAYGIKKQFGNVNQCLCEEARMLGDKKMLQMLLRKKIIPESPTLQQRRKDLLNFEKISTNRK